MLAPAVISAEQLPVLYWIHKFLIQKFTIYFTRSTMSLLFKSYCLICSIIPVLWIRSTYVVPKILVILWGENGKAFLYNFFENPKRTRRLADLNASFLSGQSFCNLCFRRFSYIYYNTVLVMIMMENWGYESRVKVITSRQPYWYCNGFLPVRCDLLSFSVPWGTEKTPELLLARGNQYTILQKSYTCWLDSTRASPSCETQGILIEMVLMICGKKSCTTHRKKDKVWKC